MLGGGEILIFTTSLHHGGDPSGRAAGVSDAPAPVRVVLLDRLLHRRSTCLDGAPVGCVHISHIDMD